MFFPEFTGGKYGKGTEWSKDTSENKGVIFYTPGSSNHCFVECLHHLTEKNSMVECLKFSTVRRREQVIIFVY